MFVRNISYGVCLPMNPALVPSETTSLFYFTSFVGPSALPAANQQTANPRLLLESLIADPIVDVTGMPFVTREISQPRVRVCVPRPWGASFPARVP